MQDRKVLVVCNLKPAKIVGFTSDGMVLAAKVCSYNIIFYSLPQVHSLIYSTFLVFERVLTGNK
jgi:hypothetical protein